MRSKLLALVLFLAVDAAGAASLPPFGLKDISLMLRTGYSAAEVERETIARHFLGAVDPAAEKALLASGASAAFVAGLKDGKYAVPPEDVAAVQAERAAALKRRAAQAEADRKLSTLYQSKQAEARPAAAVNTIAPMLHGDLVTSRNGLLSSFNDQTMEKKKLIGFYFSAHWCGPCRKFTPELVEYYNRVAPSHPEFEIVFVSCDRSPSAMEGYMRDMQMPWPAIVFDKVREKTELAKYAGQSIPCLVIVDETGKVISDTNIGGQYLGPSSVLHDLDRIFGIPTAAN